MMMMNKYSAILMFAVTTLLSGCSGAIARMKNIDETPQLDYVKIPTTYDLQEEVDPDSIMRKKKRYTNSLWQAGTTTFFQDSRAWRAGDIIRVLVSFSDSATLSNATTHARGPDTDSVSNPTLMGKGNILAQGAKSLLFNTSGSKANTGSGTVTRSESVATEIAATVLQVLENGNLVIQGKQEVRVNNEVRAITVAGIIRPRDIDNNNSVTSDHIAEARISYGGRGTINDLQRPRYGYGVIEAISPF